MWSWLGLITVIDGMLFSVNLIEKESNELEDLSYVVIFLYFDFLYFTYSKFNSSIFHEWYV